MKPGSIDHRSVLLIGGAGCPSAQLEGVLRYRQVQQIFFTSYRSMLPRL